MRKAQKAWCRTETVINESNVLKESARQGVSLALGEVGAESLMEPEQSSKSSNDVPGYLSAVGRPKISTSTCSSRATVMMQKENLGNGCSKVSSIGQLGVVSPNAECFTDPDLLAIDAVLDGQLYLSGMGDISKETLDVNCITHVLCVAKEAQQPDVKGITTAAFHGVHLQDNGTSDLSKIGPHLAFIRNSLEGGGRCLVHCRLGVNRSASVVILYLMVTKGLTYDEAFKYTKSSRSSFNPVKMYRKQMSSMPATWIVSQQKMLGVAEGHRDQSWLMRQQMVDTAKSVMSVFRRGFF